MEDFMTVVGKINMTPVHITKYDWMAIYIIFSYLYLIIFNIILNNYLL